MKRRKTKKERHITITRYIWLAVLIFLISLAAASLASILLRLISFTDDQSAVIADMVSGIIAAVAAGLVLFELRGAETEHIRQNNIEEASFILQYNQSFIQDANMAEVEGLLEQQTFYDRQEPIITDDNRQKFINYLVYLEGLAPLIIRGVLNFEHIDDLMAYRFFLAVDNLEVQEDQLKKYADYYRGCFKLYEMWREYRDDKGLRKITHDHFLDEWEYFFIFSEGLTLNDFFGKQLTAGLELSNQEYKDIAALIYDTDPYIYPALFGERENAITILPEVIERGQDEMFCKENIYVYYAREKVIGVILWHEGSLNWNPDELAHAAASNGVSLVEKNIRAVTKEYLVEQYSNDVAADNRISIINVCVAEPLRGSGISKQMLRDFMALHQGKDMELVVLAGNEHAIKLY
ncbi:MAG: hypothetical protein IKE34_00660, partial [Paenibacillus sp.]|nr:hypothetical protein [Paenibacillus sp.]